MADNANVTAGDGTIVVATDKIGGVDYQRVKVTWGPDGTANDTDVASGKPMPVQLRASDGTAVPVNANGQATMANSQPIVMASDFVGTSGFMKKEDVASADGDAGIAAMGIRQAIPANSSGTDGDYEMLRMSAGQLWINHGIWQPGTNGFIKTPFSGLTTELNSLANGNTVASSVGGSSGVFSISNSGGARKCQVWLTLGGNFGATPAAGGTIVGWFLNSTDGGTTFQDVNANTGLPTPPDFYIPLVAAAYSANDVVHAIGFPALPPGSYKVYLLNNAGASAALAASGNILTIAPVA